jgi:phosphatidylcholine synthase
MSKEMARRLEPEQIRALAVHMFTASGALVGLMSLVHLFRNDITGALMWLGIALVIDAIDGPLARKFRVSEVLPGVDGAILDHVIDYSTYTMIPAVIMYHVRFMPSGWDLTAAGLVVVSSLYCFANKTLKTRDNFFTGFPATWNLVVLGFYILETPPALNAVVLVLCVALTFVPLKFVHPFRVRAFRPLTMALTFVWGALAVFLVIQRGQYTGMLARTPWAYWGFIAVSVYFIVISIRRSIRGKPDPA